MKNTQKGKIAALIAIGIIFMAFPALATKPGNIPGQSSGPVLDFLFWLFGV